MEGALQPKEKGLCPHGNFPASCSKCRAVTKLDIYRENLSGSTQKYRGKANIRYEKGGERRVAKYATRAREAEGLDNIAGLAREARLLEKLADTELVPRVADFKMYPNERKARLLLEEIPGVSLDHMPVTERRAFVNAHAQEIILKTAEALQRVNDAGVHVVDINEGTFMFDKKEDGDFDVRILDLELGCDETETVSEGFERARSFMERNDPSYNLAVTTGTMPKTLNALKTSEMYRWAKTLGQYIFPRLPLHAVVAPERQAAYEAYLAKLEDGLREKTTRDVKRQFSRLHPERDAKTIAEGEAVYVTKMLKWQLANEVRYASLPFTLPDVLNTNGVTLDARTINFLERCLSYDPADRPEDFGTLLQSA